MLENARWAPTHKITEPWHFQVFHESGLRRLVDFMKHFYKTQTPPENIRQKKLDKFDSIPQQASHIISISMKRDPEERIPEVEEISSVAIAVQNMMLTATAHGIGSYWSSGSGTYSDSMKEFLSLDQQDKCLGFLYVGVPQKDLITKTKRSEITEKVRWVSE
jgi:nitroreductase